MSLASNGLAFARGERGKEIVEALVAGIIPMELLVGALQKSQPAKKAIVVFSRESDVNAGSLVDATKFDETSRERAANFVLVGAGPYQ